MRGEIREDNVCRYERQMWWVIESIDPSDAGHFLDCDGDTVRW